ncbi:Sec-independent protein translocase subunit TatA [Pseudonocardia sp.]|jgi:sec-independent protein translocase protein TatA|uniref:Sec-independent protein translocase subunit TatA n=1 Tax=Pseudonocardia sp. TaxID=60912 RepID=UPI0031FD6F0E
MGALSPTHWMIVIGILVLLFGAKRLPDAARSLGRSARILKAEVRDMSGEETAADATPAPPAAVTGPAPVTATAAATVTPAEAPASGAARDPVQ